MFVVVFSLGPHFFVKIYVAAVWKKQRGKRKEGMKLSLPTKLVEKLIWVPVTLFCKISFPVTYLMPYYYAKIWLSSPPNRPTLRIPLMYDETAHQNSSENGGL